MAKKYLVEVADKGGKGDVGGEKRGEKDEGHKGGSDYRFLYDNEDEEDEDYEDEEDEDEGYEDEEDEDEHDGIGFSLILDFKYFF